MNLAQEYHLAEIIGDFRDACDKKFRKGAEEHGGDLRDMTPLQLVENAMDECVDQWTYLNTLRKKLLL